MKALAYYGLYNILLEDRPKPIIIEVKDSIVDITVTTINITI